MSMKLPLLLVGILLLVLTIVAPVIATLTTPTNLRGFYSAKYIPIALIGAVGGLILIVLAIIL